MCWYQRMPKANPEHEANGCYYLIAHCSQFCFGSVFFSSNLIFKKIIQLIIVKLTIVDEKNDFFLILFGKTEKCLLGHTY